VNAEFAVGEPNAPTPAAVAVEKKKQSKRKKQKQEEKERRTNQHHPRSTHCTHCTNCRCHLPEAPPLPVPAYTSVAVGAVALSVKVTQRTDSAKVIVSVTATTTMMKNHNE
jgi:hypothetical protein